MAGVEFIAAEKTERKFSSLQVFEKSQNADGIGDARVLAMDRRLILDKPATATKQLDGML
jgi:hypothetical protein